MRTALLDADIIVWKAAALGQDKIELEGDTLYRCNWNKMLGIANGMVRKWTSLVAADQFIFVTSDRSEGGQSFRYRLADDYHANRKGLVRPDLFLELHWEMVKRYDAMYHPGLEGDDVLGLLATSGEFEEPVIVTEDKDMWSIPCGVFLPTRSKAIRWVNEETANRYWFRQSMIGDAADNYKGCHGIGPGRAAKLLAGVSSVEEMWKRTKNAFLQHGHTVDDALQQLRLARILRTGDIDDEWTKVRLWHPEEDVWLTL